MACAQFRNSLRRPSLCHFLAETSQNCFPHDVLRVWGKFFSRLTPMACVALLERLLLLECFVLHVLLGSSFDVGATSADGSMPLPGSTGTTQHIYNCRYGISPRNRQRSGNLIRSAARAPPGTLYVWIPYKLGDTIYSFLDLVVPCLF